MTDVVAAEEVRKTYGDAAALAGVSLSVGAGEVFALVGPNGAGKTTLVRALTGTTEPDAGTVSVFGSDPGSADRQRLGLLPQSFAPAGRLTARELVAYYAGLYDEARDPDAVLADVGVADAADTRYENLSGGQQRRTCVATALVNDPDLLFLDEPTTGIDPAGRRALWEVIADLAAGGTTVVLTTHYMEEAERLADRVGLLADGELAAVGTPADLVAEHGGRTRLVVDLGGGDSRMKGDVESREVPSASAVADALADAGFEVEAGDAGTGVGSSDDGVGTTDEGELVVPGVQPEDIGDVVAALDDRGVAYESLAWRQPGLEDAYLRVTGRSAAGDGVGPEAADATGGLAGGEP